MSAVRTTPHRQNDRAVQLSFHTLSDAAVMGDSSVIWLMVGYERANYPCQFWQVGNHDAHAITWLDLMRK